MKELICVQYGCGFCTPQGWQNHDGSPTLRFERIPVPGKPYTRKATRFSLQRTLTTFGAALILLRLSPAPGICAETNISAAAYLASQPKPDFQPGYHLPHLTHWGGIPPFDARVELACNWGYAIQFSENAQLEQVSKQFQNTNSVESRVCVLAAGNPQQFPLEVILDRKFPEPVPDNFWIRDEQGRFTDGKNTWQDAAEKKFHKIVSPESPDEYWQKVAESYTEPLKLIHQHAPITIVLNGGEYGVGVPGFDIAAWDSDPRVHAARGSRSWFEYASERKAHYEEIIAKTIREALPDRELYIYYNTTSEGHRATGGEHWKKWSYDSAVIRNISDLPSFECYYQHFNTGWTGNNDALTQFLNSAGYHQGLGAPLSYNWVCGGWERGGKDDFSDIPHYLGFLKCLYTAGMVGGVACTFARPKGGLGTPFPADAPPQWLQQMMALSRVHAFFSHLEPFLRQGYLLPGPDRHKWSKDQPAYEFPTGDPDVRVLARKLRTGPHWLVTIWATVGDERQVQVEIPELGQLSLTARASGSVYHATKFDGKIQVMLLDKNGVLPTENMPAIELENVTSK